MLSIISNRVAIWSPQMMDGLQVRSVPIGSHYLTKDSMVYKATSQPMWRYVKNYEAGKGKSKVKFCLFVRSFEEDGKFVEAELDRIVKEIPKEFVENALKGATFESFVYTDFYINEKIAAVEAETVVEDEEEK